MPSLRENLKDHPVQSLLTGLASLATIIGFIFIVRSEACNNNDSKKEVVTNKNNKPVLLPEPTETTPQTMTDTSGSNKVNEISFSLDSRRYISTNYMEIGDIHFYFKEGNWYRFTSTLGGTMINGQAELMGHQINLYGEYGNSTLSLEHNNNLLVGIIKGQNEDINVSARFKE